MSIGKRDAGIIAKALYLDTDGTAGSKYKIFALVFSDDERAGESVSIDNQKRIFRGLRKEKRVYQYPALYRNVNRLFDTKGMNRISGNPCLILGLCQAVWDLCQSVDERSFLPPQRRLNTVVTL